jgi:hypothetical protein
MFRSERRAANVLRVADLPDSLLYQPPLKTAGLEQEPKITYNEFHIH